MKALVTGGAGFIGSHLSEALLDVGHEVAVIDDLSTGSRENVQHLVGRPGFSLVVDTIMDEKRIAGMIERADVVFHLAAAVGVRLIVERPIYTIETNIKATEIILELCAEYRKKVLLTSTSEVYGKSPQPLFDEEGDLVLGPTTKARWCYAASKIVDEFLALAYNKEKQLPVIIVRLFNTIGPRQTGQYGMVVPTFVRQALKNEPITVFGDGSQCRSFTWVEDVVNAIVRLSQHAGAVGRVFNIGHTEEITILKLALLIKTLAKSDSRIVQVPYDEAYEVGFEDMARRLPDISRIAKLIGYKPSLDLRQMLVRIIESEKKRLLI